VDQLGALGLVLNAIVLWNTRYLGLALDELRAASVLILPEDVERLSPLVHHHNPLDGRYSISLPDPLAHGELRPLRNPNDLAEQVHFYSRAIFVTGSRSSCGSTCRAGVRPGEVIWWPTCLCRGQCS
jgi:hypothetical protein